MSERQISERFELGFTPAPAADGNRLDEWLAVLGLAGEPMRISERFELGFTPAPAADGSRLDEWLAVLGLAMEPMRAAPAAAAACPVPVLESVWRILLIARALLQAGRVPVFDAPEIVSAQPDPVRPGGWRIGVLMPIIEMSSRAWFETALSVAIDAAAWAGVREASDANLPQFYAGLEENAVSKLIRMVPGGKSTVPALKVAHELGIPFVHLGSGVYQLGWGSRSCRLDRSVTEGDSSIGARMTQSKLDTARLLWMSGLPGPRHGVATSWAEALEAARRLGWPVVVKPADQDRGEGVTVDVTDEAALRAAFDSALQLSKRQQVIVEQQVPGTCHRLFIAAGRLLYAVKRMPMSVQADGRSTVAALVAAQVQADQCKPPWQRSGIQPLDNLARQVLLRAGWSAESVAPAGTWLPLRRIESTAWGGVDEDVTDIVHPDNLTVALKATSLFGLQVAGIDIITEDIARPWHETQAIINEVNFAPLLGGGEISRRHIPEFLHRMVPDGGRIPIEVFIGDAQASSAARLRWDELRAAGSLCYFVSRQETLDGGGAVVILRPATVRQRVRSLLLDRSVDAVVVLMTQEEFDAPGAPLPASQVRRFYERGGDSVG